MQFACDLASVEFTKVAQACGVRGFRVEDPTEMRNTVHAALDPTDLRGSAIVDPLESPFGESLLPAHAQHLITAYANWRTRPQSHGHHPATTRTPGDVAVTAIGAGRPEAVSLSLPFVLRAPWCHHWSRRRAQSQEVTVIGRQPKHKTGAMALELAEEPSTEWGWHGHFPKVTRFSGWVVMLVLLAMITVDRLGHIPEIFLCVLALLMVLVLVRDGARRRNSWRRR